MRRRRSGGLCEERVPYQPFMTCAACRACDAHLVLPDSQQSADFALDPAVDRFSGRWANKNKMLHPVLHRRNVPISKLASARKVRDRTCHDMQVSLGTDCATSSCRTHDVNAISIHAKSRQCELPGIRPPMCDGIPGQMKRAKPPWSSFARDVRQARGCFSTAGRGSSSRP